MSNVIKNDYEACLLFDDFVVVCNICPFGSKKAEIEFKQTKYDFHEIAEENGDVSHIFTFINKGNAPLIITRASANCGCTKPEYPVKPVAPGKEGQIKVTYQPKGRPGSFSKNIYVYTNGEPERVVLLITGTVIPKP